MKTSGELLRTLVREVSEEVFSKQNDRIEHFADGSKKVYLSPAEKDQLFEFQKLSLEISMLVLEARENGIVNAFYQVVR
jgi:hypothetical protein